MMAFLAACMMAVMVAGCPDPEDEKGTGTGGGTNAGNGGRPGNLSADWSIASGPSNSVSVVDGNTLKVEWKAAANWGNVEVWGRVPTSVKLEDYDGLQFDIKIDTPNNYLILIRAQGSGDAWKLAEDYIPASDDWQEVNFEFDSATDPGWDQGFTQSTLAGWLAANPSAIKRVYISPVLNPGAPPDDTKKDNQFTTYYRNIGFYKDSSDETTLVW